MTEREIWEANASALVVDVGAGRWVAVLRHLHRMQMEAILRLEEEQRKLRYQTEPAIRSRLERDVLDKARKVSEHWTAQDGINGAVIDELVDAVSKLDSKPTKET